MKWFGHSNKTSAFYDHKLTLQVIGWSLVYFILVWFVITSRRRRLHTFTYGSISLLAGALLSLGICDSNWMTGIGELKGSYSRWTVMKHGHSEMLIPADLTVHIGLTSINVTFASHESDSMNFFYNEELEFERRLRYDNTQFHRALEKGLPNPILSVFEFILLNSVTPSFEKAGYLTQVFLVAALVIWSMNQVIYINVPRLAVTVSMLNGCWILLAVFTYVMMIQKFAFVIYVEGSKVNVSIGRSVALVTVSAVLQLMPRLLVLMRLVPKSSFEVDFGTPWDNQYVLDHQAERQQSKITSNDDQTDLLKDKISSDDLLDDLKKGQDDLASDNYNDLKKTVVDFIDPNKDFMTGKTYTSDLIDLKLGKVKGDLQNISEPVKVLKDELRGDLTPSQGFECDLKPSQEFKSDLPIKILTPDVINANLMENLMRDGPDSPNEIEILEHDNKISLGNQIRREENKCRHGRDDLHQSNTNSTRAQNLPPSTENHVIKDDAQCTYKHKHYHKPHTDINCRRKKHDHANHNHAHKGVPGGIDNPAFDYVATDSILDNETRTGSICDSNSTISSISTRVESGCIGSTVSNLLSKVQFNSLILQNNPGSRSDIHDQDTSSLQSNKIEGQLLSPGKLERMLLPSFDPRHRTSTPDIDGDVFSSGNNIISNQSHGEASETILPNICVERTRLPSVVTDNERVDRKQFWRSRVHSISAANEMSRRMRAKRPNAAIPGFDDRLLVPGVQGAAAAGEKQRAKSFNDTLLGYGNS